MSYACKILADSVSPDGVRLTTFEVTFPRFILAEVNTHRMLSRNSASSRAIPTEKLIERVENDPFIPETFNQRVKGMGVGDPLEEQAQKNSRDAWLWARWQSVEAAKMLVAEGADKPRVNRLLEPFMWHTAIITATEWNNFFALRCHPDAQPEFQIIAKMMRNEMRDSEPVEIGYEDWHLPLVEVDQTDITDERREQLFWPMVSAGRCARVSFDTHLNYEESGKSWDRAVRLKTNGHLSPAEHPARPMEPGTTDNQWSDFYEDGPTKAFAGNFRGWVQLRKMVPNEDRFDLVVQEQTTA